MRPHLPFIDWMKCLGMALIVYGHVGATVNHLVPPIYPKQLGVAFFLFAAGFSLARETRPRPRVVFDRLFEVVLFGVAFALIMSGITYARIGDLNESNYLPFLLGGNVVIDAFPANPTTWYIGTYIHVILIWAALPRGFRVRPRMLAAAAVAEVLIRATLAEGRGLFVAYMAFPNWATVFLAGLMLGQAPAAEPAGPGRRAGLGLYLGGLTLFAISWWLVAGPLVAEYTFPFMRLAAGPRLASLGLMSAAVTVVYTSYTLLTYQITRRLRESAVVRFFARNTLIIFIAHMPIYYALRGPLGRWTDNHGVRAGVQFLVDFVLLAFASEAIRRAVRPRRLRDRLGRLLFGDEGHRIVPDRTPAGDVDRHVLSVADGPRHGRG